MAKKKHKQIQNALMQQLETMSRPLHAAHGGDEADEFSDTAGIQVLANAAVVSAYDTSKTLRLKKFRFQLMHQWLLKTFAPCKAADIGGGKGLLCYLLRKSQWDVTVIDPFQQALPDKYKDILLEKRVKIDPQETVPFLAKEFSTAMGQDFNLLIGMHAHGCNAKIIDAAERYGCGFVLFPCCIIDEPFYPRPGVHWIESLADYALGKGIAVRPFRLNFSGQNIGLYYPGSAA